MSLDIKHIEKEEKKYIRLGLIVVLFILGSILGWAFFAKVDTVVIAPGKVVVKSYKKPIEHKEWGTVTKIFVKEGDFVKKGEPLIELEKIEKETNLEINKADYYSLLAQRDRLLSEKNGYKKIKFSEEFLKLDDENLKTKIMKMQQDLFNKRVIKLKNELSLLEERENQLKKRISGLKELKNMKLNLLKDYKKQLKREEELIKNGLSNLDRKFQIEEKIKQIEIEIKDIDNQIEQATLQIDELEKQKNLKLQEYKTDISDQLEKVITRLNQVKPKIKLSEVEVKKSIIKAPSSGQIIGLQIKSKGQVVKPGDILMYIVPKKDKLFILAKVNPQDRDKVKEGQLVDLQFPSFISIGANVVEGKVSYVASDTLFDEITRQEYYETHIELTEKGWKQLKKYKFEIIPGMPATAFIKVEKVTPLEYIMQPIILMIKSSFTSN